MRKIKKKSKFPDKSPSAKAYQAGVRETVRQIEKAASDFRAEGMDDMMVIFLYILRSKYHSSDEDLEQLAKDIMEHARYIAEGKLTIENMKIDLKNVYNVEVNFN